MNLSMECEAPLQYLNFVSSNAEDKACETTATAMNTINTIDFGPVLVPDFQIKEEYCGELNDLENLEDYLNKISTPVKTTSVDSSTPMKELNFSPSQVFHFLSYCIYIHAYILVYFYNELLYSGTMFNDLCNQLHK